MRGIILPNTLEGANPVKSTSRSAAMPGHGHDLLRSTCFNSVGKRGDNDCWQTFDRGCLYFEAAHHRVILVIQATVPDFCSSIARHRNCGKARASTGRHVRPRASHAVACAHTERQQSNCVLALPAAPVARTNLRPIASRSRKVLSLGNKSMSRVQGWCPVISRTCRCSASMDQPLSVADVLLTRGFSMPINP